MRVIGGKYRGKKLFAAPESITRPTSDRAKEGLFNVLDSHLRQTQTLWEEVVFVDAFAGSGAIGLEALSRGAKKAFFFEQDKTALSFMHKNLAAIQADFTVLKNALTPPKAPAAARIYFSDAPYHQELSVKALNGFYAQGWIDKNTLIIIETDGDETLEAPACFELRRRLSYGRNHFSLYQLTEA